MRNNTRLILLNIIGGILFLALPLLFAPGSSRLIVELTSPPTIREIIAYSLLIGFFYLNFFVLIPKLYFKHKYILFGAFIIICFAIITSLPNIIIGNDMRGPMPPMMTNHEMKPPPNDKRFSPPPGDLGKAPFAFHDDERFSLFSINNATHHLFLFLGVFFFSLLLKINDRWKKAEEEKVTTELSYLKAQINPHFLFNTLNSIYSMALEKSDNTATAVVKLSAMMRYVLSDSDKEFVLLEQEINYITSYIELQRIRFEESLPLEYNAQGFLNGKKIAPLILIPFIENAFKHGVNAEEDSSIKIEINVTDNDLKLIVVNNKVAVTIPDEDKTGVGIENVKSRLKLLYPAKHTLTINDEADVYFVELKLNLA